jgi:hypothetical protein
MVVMKDVRKAECSVDQMVLMSAVMKVVMKVA